MMILQSLKEKVTYPNRCYCNCVFRRELTHSAVSQEFRCRRLSLCFTPGIYWVYHIKAAKPFPKPCPSPSRTSRTSHTLAAEWPHPWNSLSQSLQHLGPESSWLIRIWVCRYVQKWAKWGTPQIMIIKNWENDDAPVYGLGYSWTNPQNQIGIHKGDMGSVGTQNLRTGTLPQMPNVLLFLVP